MDENQENNLEKNLVWLFGTVGSGKNWFAENLSEKMKVLQDMYISDHIGVSAGQIKGHFVRRKDLRKTAQSYFFSKTYKQTWQFYLRKLILNRIYSEIENEKLLVLIKEPATLGASDVISECLPNSKIMIMIRDGRPTIDYFSESRQTDGFVSRVWEKFPTETKSRLDYIDRRAKLWTDHVTILMKTYENHPSENRLCINYEDLLVKTPEIIKKIYEFIGIEINQEKINLIATNFKRKNESNDDWNKRFSKLEIEKMNDIMKDKLEKFRI